MNNNSSKQVLLSVIGVAILVVAVVGVSFAFFYFTDTSDVNTVSTGMITFTASTTEMELDNVFPTTNANDTANVATATINVSGQTSYDTGIAFTVYAEDVENNLAVPVTLAVEASGLTLTGETAKSLTGGQQVLCAGTIPAGDTAVTGTITVKAYVNGANVLISDNKEEDIPASVLGSKTLIKTSEWNNKSLTFKIRVVATQTGSTLSTTDRVQP